MYNCITNILKGVYALRVLRSKDSNFDCLRWGVKVNRGKAEGSYAWQLGQTAHEILRKGFYKMTSLHDFVLFLDDGLIESLKFISPYVRVGFFISLPIGLIGGFISYANKLRK